MGLNSSDHENGTIANSSSSMEELDVGHFHSMGNYSQFNGTNGTIANLSLLNFDVDDENPYGLRYGMATTVVLRYAHPFHIHHLEYTPSICPTSI